VGPGLPFPGKYPTRWWIELTGVRVRWSYLGKPSAMAYRKLCKLLTTLKGPVTYSTVEFDRGGRIYYANLELPGVGDPKAFLLKGQHVCRPWKEYHTWDQKGLGWVLEKHMVKRLQTAMGAKRFYIPIQRMAQVGWQEEYRVLHGRHRPEELDNDF